MATAQRITRDGKTYYRVQIRRPTKGITLDEYFATKRAADKFLRDVTKAIDEGKPITQNVRSRATFADAVETFLADPASKKTRKGEDLKDRAWQTIHERVRWLSENVFRDVYLKHLTWDVVDQKLSQAASDRKWSSATRYRYETCLSRFLDYCRKNQWVALNVIANRDRINKTEQRQRTFTTDEWSRLLDAADERRDMLGMFLRLAWATGCRKSELLRLRWVDVEPVEQEGLGAKLEIRDTKNHEDRTVFIDPDLYRLLQAHEQEYRIASSPLLFPSRTRNGTYAVHLAFDAARKAAKLDKPDERHGEILSIHHIRHSWATRLGDSKASLAQLMAAGGWKTPGMAARYMKVKATQAAEAALLLAGK